MPLVILLSGLNRGVIPSFPKTAAGRLTSELYAPRDRRAEPMDPLWKNFSLSWASFCSSRVRRAPFQRPLTEGGTGVMQERFEMKPDLIDQSILYA